MHIGRQSFYPSFWKFAEKAVADYFLRNTLYTTLRNISLYRSTHAKVDYPITENYESWWLQRRRYTVSFLVVRLYFQSLKPVNQLY